MNEYEARMPGAKGEMSRIGKEESETRYSAVEGEERL